MICYKFLRPEEVGEKYYYGMKFHNSNGDFNIVHTHTFWEFILCTGGSYTHCVNYKDEKLKVGDAAILKPGDIHTLKADTEGSSHLNIAISDEVFKAKCDLFSDSLYDELVKNSPARLNLSFNRQNKIQKFLKDLLIYNDPVRTQNSSGFVIFNIIEPFYEVISEKQDNFMPVWFKDVLIKCNSLEHMNWKPRDVSDYTHYSQAHINRFFKKIYNMTLVDYLINIKMNNATQLLTNTDLSLNEIITLLGYNSISYFSHTFKKYYNISPYQYKLSAKK